MIYSQNVHITISQQTKIIKFSKYGAQVKDAQQ